MLAKKKTVTLKIKKPTCLRDQIHLFHYVRTCVISHAAIMRLFDFKECACARILNLNSAIINCGSARGDERRGGEQFDYVITIVP